MRSFSRFSSRRRRSRAGYTMIEVMMAVGVLTVGSMGIMAMHQASTRGNQEARQMMVGTQLTQRWIERLRRDGLSWMDSAQTADPTLLASTTYLRSVVAPGGAALWFIPVGGGAQELPNFDYYGNDTAVEADMRFCTNVRLEWVYPGRAMRADVRVWWLRRQSGSVQDPSRANFANCAPGQDPNALSGDYRLRMTHASTVIRYTPRPR